MPKLQVFDPAMCCPTGVCGPSVDPALVRFAADLEWLKANGVEVERVNLSQDPVAFAASALAAKAIESGSDALPLILVDGKIVAEGLYPERNALADFVGLAIPRTLYTDAVHELVAIGAAIAANCEPCFRFHYDKARKLGISKDDMARAVATAKMVKEAPARAVVEQAERYLETRISTPTSPECCAPREPSPKPSGGPKSCC